MSIEARTVAWTAFVLKQVMTLADALWFITYWWHETVTTLHSHSPAPKPYAHIALAEAWGIWAMAGKLDGRKEVKEQWDKPHCDEGWGVHVHTTVAWDGYQCFGQKIRPFRKEGRGSTVGQCFACVDTPTIATFVAFTVPSTTPMSNTRHEEVVWLVYIRL